MYSNTSVITIGLVVHSAIIIALFLWFRSIYNKRFPRFIFVFAVEAGGKDIIRPCVAIVEQTLNIPEAAVRASYQEFVGSPILVRFAPHTIIQPHVAEEIARLITRNTRTTVMLQQWGKYPAKLVHP